MNAHKVLPSKLTLAVQAALVAMFVVPAIASADESEIKELTQPTNTVQVGVGNADLVGTTAKSAKFGEYNGQLKPASAYGIANIDMRGGNAYTEEGGTYRWAVKGTDLGTTSLGITGGASKQGSWTLNLGYDELQHNLSSSYNTPYVGQLGGNSWLLPTGFGTVANTNNGMGVAVPAMGGATQLSKYQSLDVSTSRKNSTINSTVVIDSRLSVSLDFNRLEQTGAKLMAFGSAFTSAAYATPNVAGESVSILPNPTNYQTDTVNLAVNWVGDKASLTAGYYGSYFREKNDRVTFMTFGGNNLLETMSTMPGNDLHQFNLSGAYAFTPATKLTSNVSYSMNTQDDPFVVDAFQMLATPQRGSLDGRVITTHADVKLSEQTTKDLSLVSTLKYDEHNNRTGSNIYRFEAIGSGNQAKYPNTPLSFSKALMDVTGDYRLSKTQRVHASLSREDVRRWCPEYATGAVGDYVAGVNNYPAGTNCVVAVASTEEKLSAGYKVKAAEGLDLNAGYSFSNRMTRNDPNAVAAFIGRNGNVDPTLAATNALAIRGTNAGDFRGFSPYFDGSRVQQVYKLGGNWQADERWSLGASTRYTDDRYGSTYGVQNGYSWSLNLDTAYAYSDTGTITAYATSQHRQRDLTDDRAATASTITATTVYNPANGTWTNRLTDDDTTIGITVKQSGFMAGKLELVGDLSYSSAWTGYSTVLNYGTATSGAVTSLPCSSTASLTCGALPNVVSDLVSFKLTGNYQVDKKSKISMTYLFQQLASSDYYYNGLQYGYNANTMLATGQTAPSYTVNVLGVSYLYNF